MIWLKYKSVNMRLVKHLEHGISSFLYCFSAFSHLLQHIRWGVKRQLFKISKYKTSKCTLAFVCFVLWNVKWMSAIFLKQWCFCSFVMIQLVFTERLSCYHTSRCSHKKAASRMNIQREFTGRFTWLLREVMNGNAVFSDSKTESSAAWSCTYLDMNEPAS